MPADTTRLSDFVPFLHELADRSAAAILPHFRSELVVDNKGDVERFDPVTEGDRAAEAAIRAHIAATYSDHAILGEEQAPLERPGRYRWVIDPIDGTRAFILGLPTWGTLIGLEIDQRPAIGIMNQPYTNERYWSDGESSYLRGPDGRTRPLHARRSVRLGDAQLASTHPDLFAAGGEAQAFDALKRTTRACRFGTDCFGYALLAAGLVDLVVEAGLKPYDIVALIPIIENAGGIVTTWEGATARHGGRILAAANPALHAEALALLQRHIR